MKEMGTPTPRVRDEIENKVGRGSDELDPKTAKYTVS